MENKENTMQAVKERIEELFDNEELLEKVFTAKTPDELWELFKENGVIFEDVTKEEVFDAFQKAKNTDELSEEELEDVSGGFWLKLSVGKFLISIGGASASTVLLTVAGVAVIGLAAYAGYRYIKKRTA